ncbi:MAG: UDP-N-acetylmuramoyl-L-alanyl-D-glutamate--2,6-diaminopimelate ligase, partial [Ruminococcaceae bacterium]|nr:UDP-N-acetylmuramoyl-L-alanyl-D-glutamate--2,6-diaminopimelate ligase [Oscillospiraceae bacterium]
ARHTLRAYEPRRLVVLFGSIGDRAKERRAELGRAVSELADFGIITSDNPGYENPEDILRDIEANMTGACPYVSFADRREAVRYAIDNARAGDCILFAGKGHEQYQIVNGDYVHYDEREEIAAAAAARIARIQ